MMTMPVLLLAALLLLSGTMTHDNGNVPIKVTVKNSIMNKQPLTYSTYVVYRGVLIGAMRRLMDSGANFNFTYSEDPNYGPFLQSVNGLAGNATEHTYWELLVKMPHQKIRRPDVGIGCYIPRANEEIIFNFTKW